MKRIKLILVTVLLVLAGGGCTWADTLAWDKEHGWAPGTTNHLLVEIYGDQANTHPEAVKARQPVRDVWWDLAGCETGYKYNNPNTGNGYFGFFQFDLQTWRSVGGPGYPHHHSYEVQKQYAQKLQAARGWDPWPYCSKKLGLR